MKVGSAILLLFTLSLLIIVVLLLFLGYIPLPPQEALGNGGMHYLKVRTDPSGVAEIPGEGWYDRCADVTLEAPELVEVSGGFRYVFVHWDVDCTNQGEGENPIFVHMDADHTATAHYLCQYYLTMSTNFGTVSPGNGWYDAGSVVSISATPPSTVKGERYVWNDWTGTGSGSYSGFDNPASLTMNAPINEVAQWTHQYRLTLATNYGTTTPSVGEHWYETGTVVEISATPPSTVAGERYSWNDWTGTGSGSYSGTNNPASITMDDPINETASWTHQYYLTVTSPHDTPGGEGWYDSGSTAYATLATNIVDDGSGTHRTFTSWGGDTSGTDYAQSDPILMNGPKTAIANWKTQYLLTLETNPNGITTPSGGGWYDAGTYASISTADTTDIVPGSSRYKFDGWTTADMSEIVDPSSLSTTVLMDKPKTVTANYITQYYLTITYTSGGVTDPLSGGWHDAGASVPVTAIPDQDYVLSRWELDGSPVGSTNPYNVLMNSAHTIRAVFEYFPPPTNYYLTVKTDPIGITPIPGQGWHEEGEDVTLTAPNYVDVSTGTRHRFSHWSVDGNSRDLGINPIVVDMDANHTATAHYILQYYLTVISAYDAPTPASGWFDSETSITSSVTSPVTWSTGTRHVCTGWKGTGSVPASGTATTTTFTINAPSSITWNWKTQHYLTVKPDPSGITTIPGEGWYDESKNVPLTAPTVEGYVFIHWLVDAVVKKDGETSINVYMDAPHIAIAHYEQIHHIVGGTSTALESTLVHAWAALNVVTVTAFVSASVLSEKKRRQKENEKRALQIY